jgi:orotate phosphoribosyltransferase-like protein
VPEEGHFDKLKRMRELKQKGLTHREIGRRLGVSTSTVSLYLGRGGRGVFWRGLRRRLRRLT